MKEPLTEEQSEQLKKIFKAGNRVMIYLWKLGLGVHVNALPKHGGQVMVIQHTGRKSGKVYRTPVNYTIVNGEIYCVAGFGADTDWYQNILANPQVEVWLPDGWYAGIAEEVFDPELRLPLLRKVLIASGFAAKAFGIYPERMNDVELDRLTHDYRLVRIRRTTARTGPGGPGELAWVWPIATFVLLFMWVFRKRH